MTFHVAIVRPGKPTEHWSFPTASGACDCLEKAFNFFTAREQASTITITTEAGALIFETKTEQKQLELEI